MEKAVLKTLAYYDVFNFPLKAWEIHKWLIGKSVSLKQIEKTLKKIEQGTRAKSQRGYWFLSSRKGLVKSRLEKEEVSRKHLQTAKQISQLFRLIPWIKLVGISGSLAMMGSTRADDIDLFIVTSKNRIWLSRLALILLASVTGLRRKRREKLLQANGKICINLLLESDNLEQKKKNIFVAHEVLQMRVLWQRDEVYSNFLHANSWAFRYLPNWKSTILEKRKISDKQQNSFNTGFMDMFENWAKSFQLKIMGSPDKSERIENGALYFHPEDKGIKVLEEYKKRLKGLSLT